MQYREFPIDASFDVYIGQAGCHAAAFKVLAEMIGALRGLSLVATFRQVGSLPRGYSLKTGSQHVSGTVVLN
jgi:hypothetical protein